MPAPTRTLVEKLAADVRAGTLEPAAEVERAWSADDAESVATFALAAAVAERPLAASSVLDAVVLLDDLLLGALLAAHVTGDRVKALIDAVARDDTTDERDALALYLAVILGKKKAPPARLIALLRTHARRGASTACGELLVAAADALGNDEVRAVVAGSFRDITPRQALDAVATLRSAMDGPILDALPDYAPASLAAPIPVRTGPRPGRNDPCPCGSGKKYKKCCQDKDAAVTADPEVAWRQQLQAAVPTLTAQQVADLRLADLASLPYEQLAPAARVAAYRQLLSHRRWDAAERVLDAMAAGGEDAKGYRIELVDQAFRARSLDVARKHAELLGEGGVTDPLVEAMLSVATPSRGSLSKLNALAERGVRGPRGAAGHQRRAPGVPPCARHPRLARRAGHGHGRGLDGLPGARRGGARQAGPAAGRSGRGRLRGPREARSRCRPAGPAGVRGARDRGACTPGSGARGERPDPGARGAPARTTAGDGRRARAASRRVGERAPGAARPRRRAEVARRRRQRRARAASTPAHGGVRPRERGAARAGSRAGARRGRGLGG